MKVNERDMQLLSGTKYSKTYKRNKDKSNLKYKELTSLLILIFY